MEVLSYLKWGNYTILMPIVQNSKNLELTIELFNFLDIKNIDKYDEIENVVFKYPNYTKSFLYAVHKINELTSKYKDELFPIVELKDNYVLCIYDNQYIKIDTDTKFESLQTTFSTPQEVWEKVIKPDIEDYYGIKIEE